MSRLGFGLAATAWGILVVGGAASAQTGPTREPTLRERLVAGLQVRRPSEFEFIDAVIDTVDRGELSPKLVDRMFFWARSRQPRGNHHRPIVYFQPGLVRVAERLGVEIEADPATPASTSTAAG